MTATPVSTMDRNERETLGEFFLRAPAIGPALALVVAIVVFSVSTSTFLELDNLSLVVEQSLVVGTLALGQTLIILTAGIDLSNAAAMVLATLLMAKLLVGGVPGIFALILGVLVTALLGLVTGSLVTRIKLPPFIVTLGPACSRCSPRRASSSRADRRSRSRPIRCWPGWARGATCSAASRSPTA
jgi:fructose transport system permease protein